MFWQAACGVRILTAIVSLSVATAAMAAEEAQPQPTDAQREALQQALTGAALVGHFVTTNGDQPPELRAERYELATVRPVADDRWLFEASFRYGDIDIHLPLTLPVRWAGDTPVIVVDDLTIPGGGTYTARVMIYADHYAGFWSGGNHGGHLFGQVKRGESQQPAAPPAPPEALPE